MAPHLFSYLNLYMLFAIANYSFSHLLDTMLYLPQMALKAGRGFATWLQQLNTPGGGHVFLM